MHSESPDDTRRERAGTAPTRRTSMFTLLLGDRLAVVAAVALLAVVVSALLGPMILGDVGLKQDLHAADLPPFTLANGWEFVLGSDSLGRSLLGRVVIAGRTTLLVAVPAVLISMSVGSALGMWAGYRGGIRERLIMRTADVILSFPALLLAVVILYVFSPSLISLIAVVAIARTPVYLRTARAGAAEIRTQAFVEAARTFGGRGWAVVRRHIGPSILPTILTVATLDFCYVVLLESSLSFLGLGIQPPDVSWGLMIASGRDELRTAWWISVFPGLVLIATTVSATVLANWARLAIDPQQRWRLVKRRGSGRRESSS